MILAKSPCSPGLLRSSRILPVIFLSFLGALVPVCQAYKSLPGLVAIRDSWADEANPTTSYDQDPSKELKARAGSPTNSKHIYLKFKVPQSFIENKATPTKATLRLYKKAGGSGTVTVYAARNNWGSGMNWNSKPMSETVKLTDGLLSNGANDFDVTKYISGPGEYSFCLKFSLTTDAVFHSLEAESPTSKPTLILEVPTGIVLQAHNQNDHGHNDEHNDYERLVSDVIARGRAYRERYMTLNPGWSNTPTPTRTISRTGEMDVNFVGYFDVTKHPYFAKADGSDDTLAIQRAINEARDAQVAVYFPMGKTFIVSEPIDCVQGLIKYENNEQKFVDQNKPEQVNPPKAANYLTSGRYYESTCYERVNHRDFPCVLMGPPGVSAAMRPKLKIATSSSAFDSSEPPTPVLRFWSRGKGEAGVTATENYPAGSYNHLIRNLDIHLSGKSRAIGISMNGTQGTAIESLKITATGAYAGIRGLPGAGGLMSAVTINGGLYGIDAFEKNDLGIATDGLGITSVLNNCIIDDSEQSVPKQINSIRWNHLGPLVLVGCSIKGGPVRIEGPNTSLNHEGEGNPSRGNLSIVDSMIQITTSGGDRPAIVGSRSPYLRNVYLRNATKVANIATTFTTNYGIDSIPSTTASQPWFLVKEYGKGANLDQFDRLNDEPPGKTPAYHYDGEWKTVGALATYGNIFADPLVAAPQLLSRHTWPGAVDWDAEDVINVVMRDDGAIGDNLKDDRQAIQSAIDEASGSGKKVFIPAGQYLLNDTLVLRENTVLFGIHKSYTVLKANDHPHKFVGTTWTAADPSEFDTATSPKPLVRTDLNQNGFTKLADIMLLQRMTATNTYLLNWRVGSNSVVQNVNFERRTVNNAKFGGAAPSQMNHPLIRIHENGGGRWYSMNHQSSGTVGAAYRNIRIDGSSSAATPTLRFYMFNPEIDSQGIYNAEILNRTNLDVFGSKFEGKRSPAIRIVGGSDIRWFGLGGNAYCDKWDALPGAQATEKVKEAVLEIDNCSSFVFSSASFSFTPGPKNEDGNPYNHWDFKRFKETNGAVQFHKEGHVGFTFFRRGVTITSGTSGINDTN